jgi:branched-chain amino acid transport system ATP-binding protein
VSLLEVRSAIKTFGSLVAVRNVSLSVGPGELRAIIGPNGAGKTTFFNLITGFFSPTSGQILLDGKDITRTPAVERVGMGLARTFQITEIFPELTIREKVRYRPAPAALAQSPPGGRRPRQGQRNSYRLAPA